MSRTVRRIAAGTAIAIAGALAITACTGPAEDGLGPMPKGDKFDGVTLNISAIADAYVQGFKKYEKQIHDELGISMKFDVVPPADAYTKDMLEFRSGKSSHDIVLLQPANLADYSPHLRPLDKLASELKLSFDNGDIESVYKDVYTSWAGTTYTVPWDGDQHNLFYNVAAFDRPENKAGFQAAYGYALEPPKTWQEYHDAAEYFSSHDWNGDGKKKYGVAEAWQQGGYSAWWWTNKFGSYGGVWFDDDMKPLIDSPSGIKALQASVDIVRFTPPGTLNFGYPELEAALLKQQVPMVIQWSSTGKAAQDPSVSTIAGNVGVSVVPGVKLSDGSITHRPALPTGWSAGIPKGSKKAAAAAYLLQWISQPKHALTLALDPKTAIDPWRTSSFQDANAWEKAFPGNAKYGDDFVSVQKQTVETGMPDLQIPGSNEYLLALSAEINNALAGKKPAEKALHDAAAAWDTITDKLGRDKQLAAWRHQQDAMKKIGVEYRPDWAR